jgi:hypothetical protein
VNLRHQAKTIALQWFRSIFRVRECVSARVARLAQKTDSRTRANADGTRASKGCASPKIVRESANSRKCRWHKGLRECAGPRGAIEPQAPPSGLVLQPPTRRAEGSARDIHRHWSCGARRGAEETPSASETEVAALARRSKIAPAEEQRRRKDQHHGVEFSDLVDSAARPRGRSGGREQVSRCRVLGVGKLRFCQPAAAYRVREAPVPRIMASWN